MLNDGAWTVVSAGEDHASTIADAVGDEMASGKRVGCGAREEMMR